MIWIIVAAVVGILIGMILHKRIVREDIRLAEKVKVLLGAKVAAIRAEAAKVVPVKPVETKEPKPEMPGYPPIDVGDVKSAEIKVKPEEKPAEKKPDK